MPTKHPADRLVHVGPLFSVERLETAADDGGPPIVRDIVRHPGAVAVVAVRDDGRLVFVRNHRDAIGSWLLEVCAGKLERGEDPAAAAARELEEETGHAAAQIRPLGRFYTSPGFADELMHVFEATGLSAVPRRLERGERIEVTTLSEAEMIAAVVDGSICDGKTIAAMFLWLRRASA